MSDYEPTPEAIERAVGAITERLKWSSIHWGSVHSDALPHIARAALSTVDSGVRGSTIVKMGARLAPKLGLTAEETVDLLLTTTDVWDRLEASDAETKRLRGILTDGIAYFREHAAEHEVGQWWLRQIERAFNPEETP